MALDVRQLPAPVAEALRSYARRKRALRVLRIAAAGAILYAVLLLIAVHVDRLWWLADSTRVTMFWWVHGILGLVILGLGVIEVGRRWTARDIAYELEGAMSGSAGERIVTLEAIRGANAASDTQGELLRQLESLAVTSSSVIRGGRLVRDSALGRLAVVLLVIAVVCGGLFAWRAYEFPLMLRRFFMPGADLPRASFVKLDVAGVRPRVGVGEEVVVEARVRDEAPAWLRSLGDQLGWRTGPCEMLVEPAAAATSPGMEPVRLPNTVAMVRVGRDLYVGTRTDLRESFALRVRCGNAMTASQHVQVVPQPRVTAITLRGEQPAYSKLPTITAEGNGASLRVLKGSEVELAFTCDQPVTTRRVRGVAPGAKLLIGKPGGSESDESRATAAPLLAEWDEATRTGRVRFVPESSASLEVDVVSDTGFANIEKATARVDVVDDAPPVVRMDLPAPEIEAVAGSVVAVRGVVEDDLAIAEAAIRYVVNPDPARESAPRESALDAGGGRVEVTTGFDLGNSGASAGDRVVIQLRARDSAGQDALSRESVIRVLPFTRGEAERRRIAAMRVVATALDGVANNKATQGELPAITPDAWERAAKAAAKAGVPLAEQPSWPALAELLEMEHFVSETSLARRDTRMIRGVIQLKVSRPEGSETLASLAQQIRGLVERRAVVNVWLRMVGLAAESARVRDEIDALPEGEVAAETMAKLNRRCTMLFNTVQDVSNEAVDLLKSAGRGEGAEGEKLTSAAGDVNETAFLVSRGAVGRRRSAAAQLTGRLTQLADLVRAALPGAVSRESAARVKLRASYGVALAWAGDAAGSSDETRRHAARGWLNGDATMLAREPFGTVAERATRWSKLTGVTISAGDEASERVAAARLELAFRLRSIQSFDRITEQERAVEVVAMLLDAAGVEGWTWNGDGSAAMGRWSAAAMPAGDPSVVAFAEQQLAGGKSLRQTLGPVGEAVTKPEEEFGRVRAAVEASIAALKRMESSGSATGQEASDAHRASRAAMDAAAASAERLSIDQCALPGSHRGSGDADAAWLRLRDLSQRLATRGGVGVEALRDATQAGASALQVGDAKAQAPKLIALFEAAAAELAKPAPTGSRQAVSLARSLSLARALLDDRGGDRAAAGAAYEGTSAALAGGLDDAAASAEFAAANWVAWVDSWSRSTPTDKAESLARSGDVRRKVIDLLASSEWLLGRLGDTGDKSSALGRAFAGAKSAADALPAEWKDAAAARTAGANLVKALSAVRRAVTPLVASAGGPDLRGGPDGGEGWRSEVAAAHERTALLWRFAEQAAVMGLARGWKDEDGAARDAYAWAALVYRLERSSLAGAGGVSMRRSGEQTAGDPTMEFLRAELEKARQRSKGLLEYAAPSREYLDLVGDYLKY